MQDENGNEIKDVGGIILLITLGVIITVLLWVS